MMSLFLIFNWSSTKLVALQSNQDVTRKMLYKEKLILPKGLKVFLVNKKEHHFRHLWKMTRHLIKCLNFGKHLRH
jgi:hypothetical protein